MHTSAADFVTEHLSGNTRLRRWMTVGVIAFTVTAIQHAAFLLSEAPDPAVRETGWPAVFALLQRLPYWLGLATCLRLAQAIDCPGLWSASSAVLTATISMSLLAMGDALQGFWAAASVFAIGMAIAFLRPGKWLRIRYVDSDEAAGSRALSPAMIVGFATGVVIDTFYPRDATSASFEATLAMGIVMTGVASHACLGMARIVNRSRLGWLGVATGTFDIGSAILIAVNFVDVLRVDRAMAPAAPPKITIVLGLLACLLNAAQFVWVLQHARRNGPLPAEH